MSHTRFRPVKRCAFCEDPADSREHAWPDRVLQRFRTPTNKIIGHVDGQAHFDPMQNGMTPTQIVEELPDLEEEDVRQALGYAAAVARDEVQPLRD